MKRRHKPSRGVTRRDEPKRAVTSSDKPCHRHATRDNILTLSIHGGVGARLILQQPNNNMEMRMKIKNILFFSPTLFYFPEIASRHIVGISCRTANRAQCDPTAPTDTTSDESFTRGNGGRGLTAGAVGWGRGKALASIQPVSRWGRRRVGRKRAGNMRHGARQEHQGGQQLGRHDAAPRVYFETPLLCPERPTFFICSLSPCQAGAAAAAAVQQ